MIWGVRLEPGKIHCENVSQDIHLTMAAMESWDSGDNEKSKSLVFLQVQQSEYLLCTLTGVLLQQHLDMRLTQGEKLTFSVRGKNSVYLTGYSENVSDISSQGDTNRLEEDDNWEDNWISKDAHTSDQDAAERAWEDETEYSQHDDSNASQSQEMANTSIIPVTIKTERVDEDNLESVSDLPNAEDSQLNLEMDDDDAFDKDVEENIGSASLSLDRVTSNSRIEGTRLISPSRSNSNCIPTMMGSGVRLQPPVCVTSSLDVRLPGGLMPLGYPSPRQLLPQIAKMGVPHDASLSYQTSMLNKLKLLQQSLNPSNFPTASNHSFLLPQPRFTSPILQKGSSLANSEKAALKNASSRNVTFVCPRASGSSPTRVTSRSTWRATTARSSNRPRSSSVVTARRSSSPNTG
ncbi:putative FK506-binding protein [Apostichopus japonicus]|uniref:Putative FK506-binding protein n=1 Tax=Stichopus japonicus TaxID=307972 RepID=A0A2G8KDG0_STIJA|nr:putative FK506-binding protein [Apostichopus japonicus]